MNNFKAILYFNKNNELYNILDMSYTSLNKILYTLKNISDSRNVPYKKYSYFTVDFVDGEHWKVIHNWHCLKGLKIRPEFLEEYLVKYR